MNKELILEQLNQRGISQKDAYKFIDMKLVKFYKEKNIQQTEEMFYTNDYIFDVVIKENFKNILEARKFMRKEYKRFLKHSEVNNVISFSRHYFDNAHGEKVG